MASTFPDDEDAPLDPAAERVVRKLRRLMAIGGLTLGLGILAVLGAIVYRITTSDARTSAPVIADAAVPPGARLVSTSIDGDRMMLGFAVGEETLVLVVDRRTLEVTGSLRLTPE